MDTLELDRKCRAPWFFGQVAICTAAGRPARCRTAWYNLFVFTQGQMHALCLRRNKVWSSQVVQIPVTRILRGNIHNIHQKKHPSIGLSFYQFLQFQVFFTTSFIPTKPAPAGGTCPGAAQRSVASCAGSIRAANSSRRPAEWRSRRREWHLQALDGAWWLIQDLDQKSETKQNLGR